MWEEFRRIETEPQLFGFSYRVAEEGDLQGKNPLFRFECHPTVRDAGTERVENRIRLCSLWADDQWIVVFRAKWREGLVDRQLQFAGRALRYPAAHQHVSVAQGP